MHTDDRELAAALALLIGRVNRRLRAATSSFGLGPLSAIATLQKHGALRLGDLAARESVSAPSMTRTITDLERRGFVVRTPDPDDGRSVQVELTAAGDEFIAAARAERGNLLATLLDGLDGEQLAALRAAVPVLEILAVTERPPGERRPREG